MKKNQRLNSVFFLGALTLALVGCSKDSDEMEIAEAAKISNTELEAIFETEAYTGVADNTLASIFQNGDSATGKTLSNECYNAVYSETGFTATFGNCVLNGSENVNGTLIVTYGSGSDSADFSARYEDFFVGTTALDGTRTFSLGAGSDENAFVLEVTSDMTVTMEDGRIISETGTRTLEFQFGENFEEISYEIGGSWTVNMEDNTYGVRIESPLRGTFSCTYLVSGLMELRKNGLAVSVDLGDGTCDNRAILTYPNGAQEQLEF